jgi:hypothetical protein
MFLSFYYPIELDCKVFVSFGTMVQQRSFFLVKSDVEQEAIKFYNKSGRLNKIDILVSKILSNNNKIIETLQKMKKVNRLELRKKEDKDRN